MSVNVTAEADPEHQITVMTSAFAEGDKIGFITTPFTPTFDVLFTVTVTETETSEVLDTKTFEYTASQAKGTTKKSDETLIKEWLKKYNATAEKVAE